MSLQEQRDAIVRYAERNKFPVALWLEEMETAAKQGRPVFTGALKLLRQGKHKGLILHKLDRGARNLSEWAAIGELADQGVEVHFVNESLDLNSRGGRLSADIQAVVAADYIRNLREETRKGFYGRLKQGLYPIRAPIGYLDQGKGKPKIIDPVMGPLVRKAFEMYGTGQFSFETLGQTIYRQGLRNKNGGRVTKNGWTTLLNNPFYIGIIHIRKTGERFAGIHKPLVGTSLFERVNAVLTGSVNARTQRHTFLYRRLLTCANCQYSLIGELQKGRVYYRCHSKKCSGVSIREDFVADEVDLFFRQFQFNEMEKQYFRSRLAQMKDAWPIMQQEAIRGLNLRLGQIKDRLTRLTDAYLDQTIDRAAHEERRQSLLQEQRSTEESLGNISHERNDFPGGLKNFLELAGDAWLSHQMADPEEKRELLKIFTSNRFVDAKSLCLEPSIPFRDIANRFKNTGCDPQQDIPRIWDGIIEHLITLKKQGNLPDLERIFIRGDDDNDTDEEIAVKE